MSEPGLLNEQQRALCGDANQEVVESMVGLLNRLIPLGGSLHYHATMNLFLAEGGEDASKKR